MSIEEAPQDTPPYTSTRVLKTHTTRVLKTHTTRVLKTHITRVLKTHIPRIVSSTRGILRQRVRRLTDRQSNCRFGNSMDARLSEFVSAGEARENAFGAHSTRHAWNSAPCRGGGPHGITRPRQRGGGGQPGRREQPSPVAMFPPGQIHPPTGPSLNHGGAPFFFFLQF